MNKKIIIIGGDPNSINSELIYKSWKKINKSLKNKIYLIANYNLIKEQFKKLKYSIPIQKVKNINQKNKKNILNVINVDLKYIDPFNSNKNQSSKYIKKSLNLGHKLGLYDNVKGIINCAIDKNLLGKNKFGVTEYLALKSNVKNNSEVMLIYNKKLSVSPITTHVDLKDVSKKLNSKTIVNKVITADKWFKKIFKKKPRIAMLGLNPHNAELRKYSEEKKVIIPSIFKLKKKGIRINGPLVSDTVFINEYKKYDIIIGMFHDQVLTPFKTLFKFDAINITLGLKYLRVSPDHGVAKNLIKKKKGNPISLIKCINFINKFGK